MDRITPKKAGYGTIEGPGVLKEFDTCTCCHCNKVWVVRSTEKKQEDPGGWCGMCMKPICTPCADYGCIPFEKKLTEYENKQKLYAAIGI